MKRIIFILLGLTLVSTTTLILSSTTLSNTIMLVKNVEALSQDEGTPVKTCYTKGLGINDSYAVFCDDRTTVEMIYPCPIYESFGVKGAESKCTK